MLDFNNDIKIEFIDTKLSIEDLDIDVELTMTAEHTSDECIVKIWNLSEETKSIIRQDATGVRILYSEGEEGQYRPIFEGSKKNRIKKSKAKKKPASKNRRRRKSTTPKAPPKPPKTQRIIDYEVDGADEAIIVELAANFIQYATSFFEKTYKKTVSTETLIKDIADSMNAGVKYLDNITHIPCPNGKKICEMSRSAMSKACDRIGANWTFSNGIVAISKKVPAKKSLGSQILIPVFDSNNSESPDFQDNDEVLIKTILTTSIIPSMPIRLDFKDIEGNFPVVKVFHKISNYSDENYSEFTIKEVR